MGNKFQKLLYNLSAAAPVCFVFSIVWLIQKKTWQLPVVCVASNELPDLRHLFVPSFECVFEILYDPIITHIASSFPDSIRGQARSLPLAAVF